MPAVFKCSSCQLTKKVKDELAGKKIKCPKCQAVGVVGSGAPQKAAKGANAIDDDWESGMANLNLGKFRDLEMPDEDDEEWEEFQQEIAPKAEKPKKVKPKKVAAESDGMSPSMMAATLFFMLIGLGIVGTAGYFVVPKLFAAAPVEVPTEYERMHNLYGEFYVEIPTAWEEEHGGGTQGVGAWQRVKTGAVAIEIREDDFGTMIANTAAMGGNAAEMSQIFGAAGAAEAVVNSADPAPVRTIHDRAKQKFEPSYTNYSEGQTTPFTNKFGDARICEVDYKDGFTQMKALRATTYSGAKAFTIFCRCPEGNFADMKPVFEKIMASMEIVESKNF